jgi:hypothetical protein
MIRWGSEGRRLPARLVAVDDCCWFCHAPVRALAGVLVDPALTADRSGFVALDDVAGVLMRVLDPAVLAGHHMGELRHRPSPGVQGGYVANGCPDCDALIGRFHVEDLVRDHIATGGTLDQLVIGVTVDLLGDPQAPRDGTDLARVNTHAPLRRAPTRPAA